MKVEFFLSNPELVLFYKSIDKEKPKRIKAQECLESIEFGSNNNSYRDINDKRFYHDHNVYYNHEDVWTKRFYVAAKL